MNITYFILSVLIVILGGAGSVLPVLPGVPLSFAGLWLYAWATSYQTITPFVLIVFALLTALTMLVDFIAPAMGAKGYKASPSGVWGSVVGAFLGAFILGPIGIIVGPFIGAFIGEFLVAQNAHLALRVAWGSFVGFALGSLFKLTVVVSMLGYLIYSVL
jgi:uncharacterized protein YqgC (DUF456 family)